MIHFEDCRRTMARWFDYGYPEVDLIVTSPPYWVGKEYEEDLGWRDYLLLLEGMYRLAFPIVRPGGYFCINFGDQARGKLIDDTEVYTTVPMGNIHWHFGSLPGFELVGTRIWRKQFARMGIPFVCNTHPRHVFDYEHLWTWRKPDGNGKEVVRDRKLSQRGVLEFPGDHPLQRHQAAFPIGLPTWCLQVFSDVGSLVYDPFLGSGTTARAAAMLDRRFIGSEIDERLEETILATLEGAFDG